METPTTPSLPSPATSPAAGALAPTPAVCRFVLYTDRRLLQPETYPAVISRVDTLGPTGVLTLCGFPPQCMPLPLVGVRHVSVAATGEPCWDWPTHVKGGS